MNSTRSSRLFIERPKQQGSSICPHVAVNRGERTEPRSSPCHFRSRGQRPRNHDPDTLCRSPVLRDWKEDWYGYGLISQSTDCCLLTDTKLPIATHTSLIRVPPFQHLSHIWAVTAPILGRLCALRVVDDCRAVFKHCTFSL